MTSLLQLQDVFALPRAGRYAHPERAAERLPLVYGDLTLPSGNNGVYLCPQIDTENSVFCLAAHHILSVAQGNSFSLYDDEGLIDPGEYTVTSGGDYEGKGEIAYATFSVPPVGAVRARCKGKEKNGSLLENPLDIIEDFLGLVGFPSDFMEPTFFSAARAHAAEKGYRAAGVIGRVLSPAETLQEILYCFLGDWWVDASRKLRVFLDRKDGGGHGVVGHLAERDNAFFEILAHRDDIVNQAPVNYAHDYVEEEFSAYDDGADTASLASQSVHGVRLPTEGAFEFRWVRDAATVRELQELIVSRFAFGSATWEFHDRTFRNLLCERGDYLTGSAGWAYDADLNPRVNQILRLLSREIDFQAQEVIYTLYDTGYYLTVAHPADGGRPAGGSVLAGGERDTTRYA